jgi:hypothetical protein
MVASSAFSRLSSLRLRFEKTPGTAGGRSRERIVLSVDPAGRLDPASAVRPVVQAADRPGRAADPASAVRRRLAGRPAHRHLGFAGRGAVRSHSSLSLLASPADATTTSPNGLKFRRRDFCLSSVGHLPHRCCDAQPNEALRARHRVTPSQDYSEQSAFNGLVAAGRRTRRPR